MISSNRFNVCVNTDYLNGCLENKNYSTITNNPQLFFQLFCKAVVNQYEGDAFFDIFYQNEQIHFAGERATIDSIKRIVESLRPHFAEGINKQSFEFLLLNYNQTFHFIKTGQPFPDFSYLAIEPAQNITFYILPYLARIGQLFQHRFEQTTDIIRTHYYGFVEQPTEVAILRFVNLEFTNEALSRLPDERPTTILTENSASPLPQREASPIRAPKNRYQKNRAAWPGHSYSPKRGKVKKGTKTPEYTPKPPKIPFVVHVMKNTQFVEKKF